MSLDTLMRGSWFSLEQCGHLLRSAVALYRGGDPITAIAVAMVAREELGKYKILRDCWNEAANRGREYEADEITGLLKDHVEKQRAGGGTVMFYGERNESGLGKLIEARIRNAPGTKEYEEAANQMDALTDRRMKRLTDEREEDRRRALYGGLDPATGTWRRPVEAFSREEAFRRLVHAINDYLGHYDPENRRLHNEERCPGLNEALDAWRDKPKLPTAEHPLMPGE